MLEPEPALSFHMPLTPRCPWPRTPGHPWNRVGWVPIIYGSTSEPLWCSLEWTQPVLRGVILTLTFPPQNVKHPSSLSGKVGLPMLKYLLVSEVSGCPAQEPSSGKAEEITSGEITRRLSLACFPCNSALQLQNPAQGLGTPG